jgi:hypothetical protein
VNRDTVRRLVLPFLAAAVLLVAAPATAATVVIVRPADLAPVMTETLVRVKGELTSVGFATQMVDAPSGGAAGDRGSRAWLEQLAGARGADAVVAIIGSVAPDSVEVWVVDKVTGKSVVRSVPFEPKAQRASETLAIRAIELLRSSFLEIDLGARGRQGGPTAAPPPAVVRFVEKERLARHPERVGIEVGAAGVTSLDGVGPALLPVARFTWAARPRLIAEATLAGLGTRPSVANEAGSGRVSQEWGVCGLAYRFRVEERVRPFLGLSLGALHTSVDGRSDSSANQGRSAAQWSFLIDTSLGASFDLRDRFYLTLAVHAQWAAPYLAVRFVDTVVATSGRPNLLATLTVGAWL